MAGHDREHYTLELQGSRNATCGLARQPHCPSKGYRELAFSLWMSNLVRGCSAGFSLSLSG